MDRTNNAAPNPFPPWAPKAGVSFGGLTLLFFMVLVIAAIMDKPVPDGARFLVVSVLSLGVALSFAFIGGDAAAKGQLPVPGIEKHAVTFSVAGGIAVFVIVLLIGSALYGPTGKSARVRVPNVAGLSHEAATTVLQENGLKLGKILERPSQQQPGTVLEQWPESGETVDQGTLYVLFVAVNSDCVPAPSSGVKLLGLAGGKGQVLNSGALGPFCRDVTLVASGTAAGHQTDPGQAWIQIDVTADGKPCDSDKDVTDNNSFRALRALCERGLLKGETMSFSLTPTDGLAGIDKTTLTITAK